LFEDIAELAVLLHPAVPAKAEHWISEVADGMACIPFYANCLASNFLEIEYKAGSLGTVTLSLAPESR
jgi:hypothetical protein